MYGYIYITTNLKNNKQYIGKHRATKFDTTYKGSGSLLVKAFLKYGWDNFECHILEPVQNVSTICESLDELNAAEKFYIDYYNCINSDNFYNIQPGGDGGCVSQSEETKHKIAEWNKNKILVHNDEVCIKIDKSLLQEYLDEGWEYGVFPFTRSEDFKQKVAASNTGKIAIHKGKIKTKVNQADLQKYLDDGYTLGWVDIKKQEVRKTIPGTGQCKYMHKADVYKLVPESEWEHFLLDGWIFGGKKRPNVKRKTGYKLSEEHRKHLSESRTGIKHSKERIERHSAKIKGRHYMYKDGYKKLVPFGEDEKYLADGWHYWEK